MSSSLKDTFDFDAPLLSLRDLSCTAESQQPDTTNPAIPGRPHFMPAEAPFGAAFTRDYGAWSVETYQFPAASPRSYAHSTRTRASPEKLYDMGESSKNGGRLSKDDLESVRNAIVQDRMDSVKDLRKGNASPQIASAEEEQLWLTANRYFPANPSASFFPSSVEPITLVFAHANGFHKETWEPAIAHLISRANAQWGPIKEIWSLDMVNHGDAATFNQDALGHFFDWSDNGRDILQFLLNYLPEAEPLSTLAGLRQVLRSTASTLRSAMGNTVKWATEDASLSHWNVSADDMREAVLDTLTSVTTAAGNAADAVTEATGYDRKVGGWTNEDGKTASTPKKPSKPATLGPSFHPSVLARQSLPEDFFDALLLDESKSSAKNNQSKPLSRTKWRNRRIVLVGHSVGGAGMTYAASTFPHLFESLVLVDPTMFSVETPRWSATSRLLTSGITRRDRWPSRTDAHESFRKNKGFYGSWDKAVLDRYVFFGLNDDQSGASLKCAKMQETYVYNDSECIGSVRAFHRMKWLPPTINVHIIRADVGNSTIPEDWYEPFHIQCKHATHTRIPGSQHLIAQDRPKELAYEIARWLQERQDVASSVRKAKL